MTLPIIIRQMENQTPSGNSTTGEKPVETSKSSIKENLIEEQSSFYARAITLAEKIAVATPQQARQNISVESLRPFETRMIEQKRYVSVPTNLEQLVSENYLFTLAAIALKTCGCIIVEGKEYRPTFKHNADQILCLNGFGVPLVEGAIPEFRGDFRGPFKTGLLCSVMYITELVKFCDKRWFNFNESKNILQTLFGEAWATKHQDEKLILDFIISVLKGVKITHMESYLTNVDELRKRLGLKANRHKNQILTDEEQRFIEEDWKTVLDRIRAFKYNDYDDWPALIEHMRSTQKLCKDAKPYSDLCKEIINDRLSFVFKGQKKTNKKQPIAKLIVDKKDSDIVGYVKVFNPCRASGMKVAFKVGKVPDSEQERSLIRVSLREWRNSYKGIGALQTRLPVIEAWYVEVLSL